MSSSVYCVNAVKFGLATIGLLLWLQLPASAQMTVQQGAKNQINISQSDQPNFTPTLDSPQVQSALPNTSERMRSLLMRIKPPVKPSLPHTTEQNIYLLLILKQRRLYVYRGDILQASYPVAVGKLKWETPTGKFKVINMVENPAWENPFVPNRGVVPPGLENPLGERWIGFWTDGKNQIGFHGTYKRDSVGKAASHGCVRMYNEDVRKLYEIVKIGTSIRVVP
ncbi:L,D-transpeptidase [Nostoc sp. LPT]|uniref:L,D-transpeptidase n=1 Tax=Nostoc sp. LPT TaxID=2815387 RepID=UPI001DEB7E16|nr:L,D-transpeptidase [Nostoc sp. LPT]MBN4001645.1 L,D-transpeptidase [Nostoc sp. LPT]